MIKSVHDHQTMAIKRAGIPRNREAMALVLKPQMPHPYTTGAVFTADGGFTFKI